MAKSPLLLPPEAAPRRGMTTAVTAAILIGALAVGVASAGSLLREHPPFGAVHVGPWRSHPAIGSADVDPYGRAILTRAPHFPVALGEGLQFVAFIDGEGRGLDGACRYRLAGSTLPSRGWTLAVGDRDGRSLRSAASYLTDGDMVTGEDGRVRVQVAASAQGGAWLRLPGPGPFTLILRFYDTPVSATAALLDPASLPAIERVGCRR
jgi:hypothetical protein